MVSDHIAVTPDVAEQYPAPFYEPFTTLSWLAGLTRGIRLGTTVLIVPYRHPLLIARMAANLNDLSGGRLILGVGVGSLREEFELLGAPFEDRGARADDAMRALRAALSRTQPEYHGRYFDFEGFLVEPCAVQPRVPMWVGGRTRRSLRRAVELGDGWAPFGLRSDEIAGMLQRARDTDAWDARTEPIDVLLQNEHPLDPLADAARVAEQCEKFAAIGATGINVRFVHHSRAHYLEQLAALATLF